MAGREDYTELTVVIPKEIWEALGPRAKDRISRILPEVVRHHAKAATHYPDGNADHLGIPGQYAEIYRKIGPLERAMWKGEELTRERPPEILRDLIGHCLLALQMYEEKEEDE